MSWRVRDRNAWLGSVASGSDGLTAIVGQGGGVNKLRWVDTLLKRNTNWKKTNWYTQGGLEEPMKNCCEREL